jgi:hypothetical protein
MSYTERDEFIIAEALATALVALQQLPVARQPTRNMTDMNVLLNSLCSAPSFYSSDDRKMALHSKCAAIGCTELIGPPSVANSAIR